MNMDHSALSHLERSILECDDDLECTGTILLDFMSAGHLTEAMNDLLRELISDPRSKAVRRLGEDSAILLSNDRFVFHVRKIESLQYIQTKAADRVAVFFPADRVRVDEYDIKCSVGSFDPEIFDPDATIELASSSSGARHPVIQRRLQPKIFDLHANGHAIYAELTFRPYASQLWMFDRATRRARFPALAHNALSSFVLLSRMLGAMKERRSLPWLEELCRHSSHQIRWAAVQAIAQIDGETARLELVKLAEDRHPHIRAGAAKVLDRLGA